MTELKELVMPDIAIDDATPTCRVVGAGAEVSGKQGHLYTPGISAQSVGARRIHLQIVRFPPDGRANAHKHNGHETAIYVLSSDPACGMVRDLNNISSHQPGSFYTSPPICLICPTI